VRFSAPSLQIPTNKGDAPQWQAQTRCDTSLSEPEAPKRFETIE